MATHDAAHGARTIFDKQGRELTLCPACDGGGCPACNDSGRVLAEELDLALARELGPGLDEEPDPQDFPTRPGDAELIPFDL